MSQLVVLPVLLVVVVVWKVLIFAAKIGGQTHLHVVVPSINRTHINCKSIAHHAQVTLVKSKS